METGGDRGAHAAQACGKEQFMASHSKTTTNHDEIRKWVDAHKGRPVAVKDTGRKNDPGVLRIDFPGGAGSESFDELSWDEWFTKFDENKLAFLYQEEKADGSDSTFFKLVNRD
jgi:hypothetical protein